MDNTFASETPVNCPEPIGESVAWSRESSISEEVKINANVSYRVSKVENKFLHYCHQVSQTFQDLRKLR